MEHDHQFKQRKDWYIVRGEEGAIVLCIYPFIPEVNQRLSELSVHARKPLYNGHKTFGKCEWLNDEICHCEALNILRAERIAKLPIEGDAFWRALDRIYTTEFSE